MKKLIEVALPLEAINIACQTEKYNPFLKGHPRSLHHWWARRPLAACRAVLWSSLVDDPSEYILDESEANRERERLFRVLEKLVMWENSNDEDVMNDARLEIARSVARNKGIDMPIGDIAVREFLTINAPSVLDPFAGGGSIPLEAQRLGLRSYASDLNPVAVLINKALIEIPPKFAGFAPVHPFEDQPTTKGKRKKREGTIPLWEKEWHGAQGLAEDVRYYGKWMLEAVKKRIGNHYPILEISSEIIANRSDLKGMGLKQGDKVIVDTWIWTRTVTCPNPACQNKAPLIKSLWLSTLKGKKYWIKPNPENTLGKNQLTFNIGWGETEQPIKGTVGRSGAFCISCNAPIQLEYIRNQGKDRKLGTKLMALVAVTNDGKRIYLSPTEAQEVAANNVKPAWSPEEKIPYNPFSLRPPLYGLDLFSDLFTMRQLLTLTILCDLLKDVKTQIISDYLKINVGENKAGFALDYANAVITYLAMAISQLTRYSVTICTWNSTNQNVVQAFARQAIPMTWDFAEANPISGKLTIETTSAWVASSIENIGWQNSFGVSETQNAAKNMSDSAQSPMIVTDPPYYDNIGYADLSDFFYVWLRPCLQNIYPEIFSTVLTPKSQELVASPYRFDGDREKAELSFLTGLGNAFSLMKAKVGLEYPVSIFYAYKQSEEEADNLDNQQVNISSTGWETMLEGLISANYSILGTWPMRTERPTGTKVSMNALASSIVLVCRPRSTDARSATRREFLGALKRELPSALRQLQLGSIAPVDLAQAAIGPGMAVYSRYATVLEADGSSMRVRSALVLINQALDEFLAEQEGEYDSDTRWALAWYEQFGHNEAVYGIAETLSTAKNTSVHGLEEAGILVSRAGKVRLLKRDELDAEWNPTTDKRLTAWEAAQHLIQELDKNGEQAAAVLLGQLGGLSETIRDLGYRLYTICERKGWTQDALAYNMLVVAWPRLKELASRQVVKQDKLI